MLVRVPYWKKNLTVSDIIRRVLICILRKQGIWQGNRPTGLTVRFWGHIFGFHNSWKRTVYKNNYQLLTKQVSR